jgi:uncharacterized protein
MRVDHEKWGNIPLLHVYDEQHATKDTPIVVFIHGFESAKEHNLHYAYNLVEQGVRVLLPDTILHGERAEGLSAVEMSMRFWEMVLTNIQEVKYLYETLREKGYTGRFGLAGTSMGGITTLGCLKSYDWIETAAVYMGTATYVTLAQGQLAQIEAQGLDLNMSDEEMDKLMQTLSAFDLSQSPERLNDRPIYFWHGAKDKTVPFNLAHDTFVEKFEPLYAETPERIRFDVAKHEAHKVNRSGMLAGVAWLAQHLR